MIYLTITLSIFSGAFYVAGFAPFNLWFAPLISLFLLVLLLNQKHPWEGGVIGLFFGLGLMGVGISWIYNSISTYSDATNEQAIMVTALFCFVLSIFYAVLGYAYCLLNFSKKSIFTLLYSSSLMRILSFSFLWVLLELIRSHLWVGFPWLLLGDAMIPTYLAPWAPIGGSFLVGFWVCITVTCVYHATKLIPSIYVRRHQYQLLGLALLTVFPWAIGSKMLDYNWTDEVRSAKIAVVQGNIPQERKWDPNYRNEIIKRYKSASYTNLDSELIIWPEASTPYVHPQGQQVHNEINEQFRQNNVYLVYGGLRDEANTGVYNSIFVAGEDNQVKRVYDKNILVPFGEFMPFASIITRFPNIFQDIDMSVFITRSGEKPNVFAIGDMTIAPSICYEVTHGEYVAKLAKNSNLLISISNDTWFGNSLGPHQHMHAAQMRALENQQYLIRASNNGVTAIVNERGVIVSSIPQFKYATLKDTIAIRAGQTPYQHTGDLPMWGISLIGLFFCWSKRRKSLNQV